MTTKNDATRHDMCVIQDATVRELLKDCDWPVGMSLVSLSNPYVAHILAASGINGWYAVIAGGLKLCLKSSSPSVDVSSVILDVPRHEDSYAALLAYSDYFDSIERQSAEEKRVRVLLVDAGSDVEVAGNLLQFALNFNSRYTHMRLKVCISSDVFAEVLRVKPFQDSSKLLSAQRSMIWPKN